VVILVLVYFFFLLFICAYDVWVISPPAILVLNIALAGGPRERTGLEGLERSESS
jgi:hypothetical protein